MPLHNNIYTFNAQNGFNTYYEIDRDNLRKLSKVIMGAGIKNAISALFTDTSQAITSIRVYPFKINEDELNELGYMTICNTYFNGSDHPKARKFKNNITFTINIIRDYYLPEYTRFDQIEPYVTAQLYLPYIGFVDLVWGELIGQILFVDYTIDYATGYATAYVNVADRQTGQKRTVAIKSGKIGFEVAWGKTNMAENLRNIASTIFTTAISLYTLGASSVKEEVKVAGRIATLSKAGLSALNSTHIKYERGGSVEGMGRLGDPVTPFIILKKQKNHIVGLDEDYAKTYGRPLYESYVLSNLRGYTVVDEIHLTGLPEALDEEVTEIENLLKSGVHL